MVVSIGQELGGFSEHRGGHDATHTGKGEKHFDVWHRLFAFGRAELVKYLLDAGGYRQTLLMQKTKVRQQQQNVFAGHIHCPGREGETAAAERGCDLLRVDPPDPPFAEELLDALGGNLGGFGRRGCQLDESPNPRFVGSFGKLEHMRVIAVQLLAQLATVALKSIVDLLIETSQFTQTNDGGITETNGAEAMLIGA